MKTLIIIAGPTASGKTDLAIQVAQHFNTEIISADSRQCYREMSIGVAKPSIEQLQTIPHHFINSHSIHEEVSAGIYERYALEKLNALFAKKDIVVCVGGTGMYIKALCEGIDEMPAVDKTIYARLESEFETKGIAWLQDETHKADPHFYHSSENTNPVRLLRALSFKLSHGVSILDFRKETVKPRHFQIIPYAIDIDRSELYDRIHHRVDEMIQSGLLKEVEELYPYKQLKSLNTVGYSELFNFLDATSTFEESVSKIKQHTRNYAKRQITWFKNQGKFLWMDVNQIIEDIKLIN